MKNKFSKKWNSSKSPGKQRKYRFNAPLHIMHNFLSSHLSPELRKKYSRRSAVVAKGDKVKVLRGQFKGRENKVDRVDIKKTKVFIVGMEMSKKDGSKMIYPIHPSNIMITELNLNDKRRKAALERTVANKPEVK